MFFPIQTSISWRHATASGSSTIYYFRFAATRPPTFLGAQNWYYTKGSASVSINYSNKLVYFAYLAWLKSTARILKSGLTLFLAIHDSKYGTTHVLFASTYTAKQLKTIYYCHSYIIPQFGLKKSDRFCAPN